MMGLTEEAQAEEERRKEERKEERAKKQAAAFAKTLEAPRPGVRRISPEEIKPQESLAAGSDRLELSGILWIAPEQLAENPYNDYPPLTGEELMELAKDIAEKGVLVPLIVRVSEDVLICGHNRKRASIEAKEPKVPVQRVLRLLSEEEERDIMKSENDRRRGGNWSREKKVEFIKEHFGEVIHNVSHGGIRKKRNQDSMNLEIQNQKFNEPLIDGSKQTDDQNSVNLEKQQASAQEQDSMNLAEEVEKKSRGSITKGTAQRIIADMRKEKQREKPAAVREKEKSSLSEKDRKRGEKLALHLKTLRQTREKLEEKLVNVKTEEKRVIKELRTIGQPALFGVE